MLERNADGYIIDRCIGDHESLDPKPIELIATAHGIEDPMDLRVVDAYWIGSALSDAVDPILMTRSIDTRFRAQLAPEAWKWLEGKPEAGARPTHAFHVFDVFPRVGLMKGGAVTDAVVAGNLDHEAGSRDIDVLRGLRHVMPLTAAAAFAFACACACLLPYG